MRAIILASIHSVPVVAHERLPIKTIARKYAEGAKVRELSIELIGGETILDAAGNFYAFAGRETWKNILLVSMPFVSERCVRDIGKASGGRFNVTPESELQRLSVSTWFSRSEKRLSARHPLIFGMSEFGLRMLPWAAYEALAKSKP
ncbi:MAG: hypothetical protein UT41_C0002G0088 [Candidatus Wolfebacteria bacterium GW2011_GWC2_39_22]|uniref:Uncharacterized protein n=2 Tax=Candidatus Wolfeibacteriota TaxID=1752735 RepID=A0A0G1JGU2_9BACT|nr:MAG: hypothetical protein UT41_C0002G0088 [Candidatus Wolfebacteria bacterium GW2011_GWC2_39_22]KKT43222.1 MAG: hypothetical protein UW32_C0002G0083 [Candidatus Wolfebacteria bacterium GW2011_GWE2_44_13]